jgi:hypothetical protein
MDSASRLARTTSRWLKTIPPLLLGGLVFACEFTTNLNPLKDGICAVDEKSCVNGTTQEKTCVSKSDEGTGCGDPALAPACEPCANKILHAKTIVCTMDFNCAYSACDDGWLDCDPVGMDVDGCETNINSQTNNCGSCGHKCSGSAKNASPGCINGSCIISCDPGYTDCNGDLNMGSSGDGCECMGSCSACVIADAGGQ